MNTEHDDNPTITGPSVDFTISDDDAVTFRVLSSEATLTRQEFGELVHRVSVIGFRAVKHNFPPLTFYVHDNHAVTIGLDTSRASLSAQEFSDFLNRMMQIDFQMDAKAEAA